MLLPHLPILLLALGSVSALDPQLAEFFKNKAVRPLSLAERAAAGIKPRHLRPFTEPADVRLNKRDSITSPDVGQPATWETNTQPQPQRGATGSTFGSSDTNIELDRQNPDNVAPPTTDSGIVPNLKWSFSLSHTRLLKGGWVREQVIQDLPPSVDVAAAELRLEPNAYRELHWHRVAEWGYILNGTGRVSAIDEDGKSYISDIQGPTNGEDPDIYYFPPGVPHSIQALGTGLEILIIFTDGNFDRTGTTFMLSDWLARTPLSIISQNLGINISELANIPQKDPYIIQATEPPLPLGHAEESAPKSPDGEVPNPYVFRLKDQEKQIAKGGGGWVKIQDSVTNFKAFILIFRMIFLGTNRTHQVSKEIASALVFVEPNGLRELHWHTVDEWLYILHGKARATAFAGSSTSRTFDFQVGDTGVFPVSYGHYIKNLSPTEPLIYLEIFKAERFVDFSATQWLALTPPQVVADLLNISVATVQGLKREKQLIIK
ncbi:Bicupin oxalate decarboxylase/oxidase [Crucibulum laeve]|uniref:Bicupin oxalate decarboxylase/oxidase n=1 Tax=Crucibulum laeve TaxID=68775 RepID=A0A5C3LUQ6_9AGAR|nr:Bicupin oxalate decarboxylase/oxidase [Crucibulum laeve]